MPSPSKGAPQTVPRDAGPVAAGPGAARAGCHSRRHTCSGKRALLRKNRSDNISDYILQKFRRVKAVYPQIYAPLCHNFSTLKLPNYYSTVHDLHVIYMDIYCKENARSTQKLLFS